MRKILFLFIFLICIINTNCFAAANPNSLNPMQGGGCESYCSGFSDLVAKLTPAVVNISTEQRVSEENKSFRMPKFPNAPLFEEFKEFFERLEPFIERAPENREVVSLGSGFVIDESGIIVTNYHVIANAKEITVTLSDNTQVKAKVLGRDIKTDLAVLKVNVDKKLPYVKLGNSDNARVGDWVIAIGNPFGLGGSVSFGIVSARARDINIGTFGDFIQTDAAINHGNSGGPLFNIKGEVVGINTAILSPSGGNVGVGFAIPSNSVSSIIGILRNGNKVEHGWLGVKIQPMTKEAADSLGMQEVYGALVAEVTAGSPADKSGIKAGDVIIEFDGTKIKKVQQLSHIVTRTEVNKKVPVKLYRSKKIVEVVVSIGKLQEDEKKEQDLVDNDIEDQDENLDSSIGLKVVNLSREIIGKDSTKPSKEEGVLVLKVDPSSNAFSKGIRKGDIIESVNQEKVKNVKDFYTQINNAKKNKKSSVLLLVNRNSSSIFITVKLKYSKSK